MNENLFVNGCFTEDFVNIETKNILLCLYSEDISGVKPRAGERLLWMKYKGVEDGPKITSIEGYVKFGDAIQCKPNTQYNISWLELLEGDCEYFYSNCYIICDNGESIYLNYTPVIEFGELNRVSISFVTPKNCNSFTLQLGIKLAGYIFFFHSSYYNIEIKKHPETKTQRRGAMCLGLCATKNQTLEQSYQNLIKDLDVLRSWGGNLIRFQLTVNEYEGGVMTLDVVKKKIPYIKRLLNFCSIRMIKVAIVLMEKPGGTSSHGRDMIFESFTYYNAFLDIWEEIAKELKNHPAIYAYDLMNEPRYYPANVVTRTLLDTYRETAQRIRMHDTNSAISVECKDADPQSFHVIERLNGIDKIIYHIHMYFPFEFTHQRVNEGNVSITQYPGIVSGIYVDRKYLYNLFKPIILFQEKNPSAKIYVGEFSAICWAEGGARYLEDCISIFEENGWDWSYHAFRDWDGWSVEHISTEPNALDAKFHIVASDKDTDRKQVLLKYFALNLPDLVVKHSDLEESYKEPNI